MTQRSLHCDTRYGRLSRPGMVSVRLEIAHRRDKLENRVMSAQGELDR